MKKSVSVRLDEDVIDEIEEVAGIEDVERSEVIRRALKEGLEVHRAELAVELYSKDELTLSESASLAGLSVGEMMDKLSERGLRPDLSVEDLEKSLEHAREHL